MVKLTKNPLDQLEYIQTNKDKAMEALAFYLDYMSTTAAYGMYACLIHSDIAGVGKTRFEQEKLMEVNKEVLKEASYDKLAELAGYKSTKELKKYLSHRANEELEKSRMIELDDLFESLFGGM